MRELDVQKRQHFVAINTTFGTSLGLNATPTALSDTEAMIILDNSAVRTTSPTNNIIVVPKSIKMWCDSTATSAADFGIAVKQDVINRWSSGGILLVSRSTYSDTTTSFSRRAAVGKAYFGDLTATAASSAVVTGQDWPHLLTNGPVDGASYTWVFEDSPGGGLNTAATLKQYQGSLPIQYIGPGCSMVIQPFMASASAGGNFHCQVEWEEINQPFIVA